MGVSGQRHSPAALYRELGGPQVQWRTDGGRFNPHPKLQSFDKAEPNSHFRGKYIRNLIRIRVSLICKLSGTPDKEANAPRFPFSPPSVLSWICWHPHKKNPGPIRTGVENFVPTAIRSPDRTVPPLASRCTDYCIPAHSKNLGLI
jgi:hypothetical protein